MARQLISGCLQFLKDMAFPMISDVMEKLKSDVYEMKKEKVKEIVDVEEGVEKLGSVLTSIQAVLFDAEKRAINDASVQNWLDKLKDVSFDIDDVLDEWNTAVSKSNLEKDDKEVEDAPPPAKKVRSSRSMSSWFSGSLVLVHDLIMRRNIASKIKGLNERLDAIDVEKSRYHFSIEDIKEPERPETTSFIDVSEVYGREEEIEVLMGKLLNESSDTRGLDIIPIVGMGGIGKTALSQRIYNDNQVKVHFHKRVWICVSDPFDEKRVAHAIIEALARGASECTTMQSLLERIEESVEGKRCLFVLDDVWTDDPTKWEPLKEALKNSAPGSRILVTTRKEKVATMMGAESRMVQIKLLSEEICWSIFSRLAFSGGNGNEQLEDIGKQIVAKCKGLPLVAKTLGSLMRYKTCIKQWKDVLHSELWQLKNDNGENSIFAPFLLSYNDLPSVEKRCLSYCSIFPKDYEMKKGVLIQLWMSQGYLNEGKNLEQEGEACFKNLAMRSFFQDFQKDEVNGSIISCKMHDIMHDFVQFLTQKECCAIDAKGNMEYAGKNLRHASLFPKLVWGANVPSSLYENKGLRTLFFVLPYYWLPDSLSLERLFLNVTTLRTLNLSEARFQPLPHGIEKLIHLRYLDLSETILRELPNSLCDLFNLQVLRLIDCLNLEQLPKEIRKLVNLRHLHIDGCYSLKHLPKGIGKLSCLQTLDRFVVPDYNSLENRIEALELEDLNMLKQLQGSLDIEQCGNLQNGSQAERAQLKNKQYLATLHLFFNGGTVEEIPSRENEGADEEILSRENEGADEEILSSENEGADEEILSSENEGAHEEILEALEPHPNLKYLTIASYKGNTISPKWMMALINLKSLSLLDCEACEFLPPLGKLPSLEDLSIERFFGVERVGVEFLGLENDDNAGAPRGYQISLFPKLKRLQFACLCSWEKWELGVNLGEEEDNSLEVMPSLQSLEISFCNGLTTLPDFLRKTPLQHLVIRDCQILKERCREGVGEEWPKISHIPYIQLLNLNSRNLSAENQIVCGNMEASGGENLTSQ